MSANHASPDSRQAPTEDIAEIRGWQNPVQKRARAEPCLQEPKT